MRRLRLVASLCFTFAPWVSSLSGQVNLPEGFEVVDIAMDGLATRWPTMNECGQIVFHKYDPAPPYDGEIYLYDNGHIVKLTDNDVEDEFPAINDRGDLAWRKWLQDREVYQVVFRRDGVETIIDESQPPRGAIGIVSLNNAGHLSWDFGVSTPDCSDNLNINFWDGQVITKITQDDAYYDQATSLNDFDAIAWMHSDFCVNPWVGWIQAYWNGRIHNRSYGTQEQQPKLNNRGHILWTSGTNIILWRNHEYRLLASRGQVPNINDRDDVYAPLWDDAREQLQPWILRADGDEFHSYRLADDTRRYVRGCLNNWGELACWFRYPDGILFLRRKRTGDGNFDGDVDLADHRRFVDCMTGPGRVDGLCDCRFMDMDHDGDVDLADYSAFQNGFNRVSTRDLSKEDLP